MKKTYRNILIISTLLSAINLILLGDDFVGAELPGSVFAYALWSIAFTVLFSLVMGVSYFVIEKKGSTYLGILTFCVILTVSLFTLDYTVLDTEPQPSVRQVIFESLVFGGMYVGIFFTLFSGVYFAFERTYRFAVERIK